jgi:transcription elongation factor Elf1
MSYYYRRMLTPSNTGTTRQGEDETCPECGVEYSVTITQLPATEIGTFDCLICGRRLKSWDGSERFNYTLKKKLRQPSKKRGKVA